MKNVRKQCGKKLVDYDALPHAITDSVKTDILFGLYAKVENSMEIIYHFNYFIHTVL